MSERVQHDRPQRREADAAGDDDDVAARRLVDRPRGPERARAAPSTAPGSAAQTARVTAPTARTVSTTGPGRSGGR